MKIENNYVKGFVITLLFWIVWLSLCIVVTK